MNAQQKGNDLTVLKFDKDFFAIIAGGIKFPIWCKSFAFHYLI